MLLGKVSEANRSTAALLLYKIGIYLLSSVL